MRITLLFAVVLLAGCATEPIAPGAPTPTASTTAPTPASDDAPWREANGSWSYEVTPSRFAAVAGDAVPFRARLHHPSPPEATFRIGAAWIGGPTDAPVEGSETTIEGVVYVGLSEQLSAGVVVHESGGVGFAGPPFDALGVERSWRLDARDDVSDDAPGPSLRAVGDRVRFTYASERNATTTADEHLSAASELLLVRDGAEWKLVTFVVRAFSDAVAPLDEPARPRLFVDIPRAELPEGDVTLRVITRVSCFCYVQPAPEVEEAVWAVPPSQPGQP